MNNAPARERRFQRAERRRQLADAPRNLGPRRHLHVVLAKINARFEQRDQFHQPLLHRAHAAAQRAAHLAGRLTCLRERLRLNQVAHGLGLSQIEFAGEKSALSKFARLSQPRA